MAITFVGSQEDSYNSATEINTRTINVNIGTPTNGMLGVIICTQVQTPFGTGDVTGITWNGTALTKDFQTSDTAPLVDFWSLANPEGGTHDVVISMTGNGTTSGINMAYFLVFWVNSDATMSKDDDNSAAFTTEDPVSIDLVPTTDGQLLISAYVSGDNNLATKGAAETLMDNLDLGADVAGVSYAIQTVAATQGMDWDRAAAGISTAFLLAGVTYKEEAGAAASLPIFRKPTTLRRM